MLTRDIDTEACAWALRVADGALDEATRTQLDAWLAADTRHRGAFLRAQAGLGLIDEVADQMHAQAVNAEPASMQTDHRSANWRGVVGAALFASLAGLVALASLTGPSDTYETDVGELRQVALQDGSLAMINTDSVVEVELEPEHRIVQLEKGEAWFQVAKDRQRPFIVSVEQVHIRATGTAFAVRRKEDAVQVVVTEGSIEAWNEDRPADRIAIYANNEATVPLSTDAEPKMRPAKEEALAWRQGEIVLNGMTVSDAADEFNRYNRRKIIVTTPAARRLRVVGYFKTNQPDLFAEMVAKELGIAIRGDGGSIVI